MLNAGFHFRNTAVRTILQDDLYINGNILRYVEIRYAGESRSETTPSIRIDNVNPYIRNTKIFNGKGIGVDSEISNHGSNGVLIATPFADIHVQRTLISNCSQGITVSGSSVTPQNTLAINNCIISNNNQYGVYFHNRGTLEVTNSYILGNNIDTSGVSAYNNITLRNCTITQVPSNKWCLNIQYANAIMENTIIKDSSKQIEISS
jgi:hypothetical protein